MKPDWSHLDKFRRQDTPQYRSPLGAHYGSFSVPFNGDILNIIATDGVIPGEEKSEITAWEHVSVHAYDPVFRRPKIPTWTAMCHVKALFWDDEEVVVQYHPAKSNYVDAHAQVLHLWRNSEQSFPVPPTICV